MTNTKQGGAHSKYASKTQDLREVVEVIDTARDNLEADKKEKEAGIVDADDSSSDDSSSDEEGADGDVKDGSKGNKQGPVDKYKDYKNREKGLHRKHRGLMQFKVRSPFLCPTTDAICLKDETADVLDIGSPHSEVGEAQG